MQEWPESQFPFQEVGRMVLDTNISNFHNESESAYFCSWLMQKISLFPFVHMFVLSTWAWIKILMSVGAQQ